MVQGEAMAQIIFFKFPNSFRKVSPFATSIYLADELLAIFSHAIRMPIDA